MYASIKERALGFGLYQPCTRLFNSTRCNYALESVRTNRTGTKKKRSRNPDWWWKSEREAECCSNALHFQGIVLHVNVKRKVSAAVLCSVPIRIDDIPIFPFLFFHTLRAEGHCSCTRMDDVHFVSFLSAFPFAVKFFSSSLLLPSLSQTASTDRADVVGVEKKGDLSQ